MRPIKFRVFAGGKMYHNPIVFDGKPYSWTNDESAIVPWFSDDQIQLYGEPVLMQFTGLVDKSGKGREVYFDDYCTAKFKTREGIKVLRGRIVEDEFMVCLQTNEGDYYSVNRLHDIEIVGNIYSTPELFTGGKP